MCMKILMNTSTYLTKKPQFSTGKDFQMIQKKIQMALGKKVFVCIATVFINTPYSHTTNH